MSDSHCGNVGSFPAVKELINKVGTSVTRGSCWDTRYFQNLIQSTCDQTFTTGASRHSSHHPFSSHLHLFEFRFRSVTMSVFRCFGVSVFLCFCASVFRAQTMEHHQVLVLLVNLKPMMRAKPVRSVAIPSTPGDCRCFSAAQHSQINFLVTRIQVATHPVSLSHQSNCAHQLP
eukprot:SAG11_NODE_9812_length_879_cov_0.644872_1_plen_173_part_10